MKFLLAVGGITAGIAGILSSYKHRGIPAGIGAGLPWAGDNCAFTGTDHQRFSQWLEVMNGYRSTCLFVAAPDMMGKAKETLLAFDDWRQVIKDHELPVAYVAQDGSENFEVPEGAEALFIGGTTAWKESQAAVAMIQRGQAMGLHIHIGRVNWGRRYKMFSVLEGSEDFTCDGTRQRYEGIERTLKAWQQYESQAALLKLGSSSTQD